VRFVTAKTVVAFGLLVMLAVPAAAEDVEKKFRLSFQAGYFDTRDSIPSDAANQLVVLNELEVPVIVIRDPRNDSAAFGEVQIKSTPRLMVSAQYAVNKFFLLEASAGWQKGELGDIEVQAQFDGIEIPAEEDFRFSIFRVPAGDVTQIPIQLSGLARFRPRASLNPYLGAGIGYIVVGFEPSSEFDDLSRNLDASVGNLAPGVVAPTTFFDLEGATVDARDSFEYHALGGMEYSFKKNWAAYADVRFMWASRELRIGFNGQESLGVSVPDARVIITDLEPVAAGPVYIPEGGLVDGGRLVPEIGAPPNTDCDASPSNCVFTFEPDGQLDTGFYYAQGGSIKYGGFQFMVGIRYTF